MRCTFISRERLAWVKFRAVAWLLIFALPAYACQVSPINDAAQSSQGFQFAELMENGDWGTPWPVEGPDDVQAISSAFVSPNPSIYSYRESGVHSANFSTLDLSKLATRMVESSDPLCIDFRLKAVEAYDKGAIAETLTTLSQSLLNCWGAQTRESASAGRLKHASPLPRSRPVSLLFNFDPIAVDSTASILPLSGSLQISALKHWTRHVAFSTGSLRPEMRFSGRTESKYGVEPDEDDADADGFEEFDLTRRSPFPNPTEAKPSSTFEERVWRAAFIVLCILFVYVVVTGVPLVYKMTTSADNRQP